MPPRTKKRGIEPGPDLPGLFPTHDGSYGINTLISVDSHKSNRGNAKAQSDDQKWVKALKGTVGKKYGMNSNLKKAIDESHKEVEEEELQGQNPVPDNSSQPQSGNQLSSFSASGSSGFSGSISGAESSGGGLGDTEGVGNPPEPPDDSGFIPRLMPHLPNYDPHNLPFTEVQEGQTYQPPYTRAALPSDNPHAHVGVNKPISPPSEHIPFYGLPQGAGSNGPISPIRPNTSRSFTYENGLFANATVQTPGQKLDFRNPHPFPQGPAKQSIVRGRSAARPTPNTQSNKQGQPKASVHIPTPSTSGEQSLSSRSSSSVEELTLETQSNLHGQHAEKHTSGWQPGLASPPDSNEISLPYKPTTVSEVGMVKPAEKHTSGWQPSLASPPDSNKTSLPYKTTTIPKVGMVKQGPSNQRGPSNPKSPQLKKNSTAQRSSPIIEGATDQQPWIFPLSGLALIRLIFIFLIFTSALMFALPTPLEELDDINKDVPRMSSFSIGTMWERLSNLLPEIPEIHPIYYDNINNGPSGPIHSDNGGVNSDELLAGLETSIPDSIWVQGKNGKLKIPEDFWHALRELILNDKSILSLKNANISEDHWLAIKSRIQPSGLGAGTSLKDMEVLEKKISQTWDSWLKQNDQALKKASTGKALTKNDFIQLAREEIASYSREISQEFTKLQERVKDITQQMSQLQDEISETGGISRDEITKIFNSLISDVVANGQADAVAQGVINGHINDILANQVNFFAIGAGVTIDPEFSSGPWAVPKEFFKSNKWLDKDGYKAQPRMAALSPWNEEGECFCAGPDLKGYGKGTNNISVIMSRSIIPQHLVVEHILPGATLDPGATPKEIEVWAYIEELNLRNELQIFSQSQFPDTPTEEVLNEGFVKIGHFTYEKKDDGDGVQVFKMSDQLKDMGAIADQIVIRAINNYGADHTCFYRLRLYGEVIERPDDRLAQDGGRSWF
ncbi:hypothetical protein F4680DRAFT_444149 [Xylaria scruposa]|nr:hypothetical protein F4680DRAFT_444149 [Xylaria scruposa]